MLLAVVDVKMVLPSVAVNVPSPSSKQALTARQPRPDLFALVVPLARDTVDRIRLFAAVHAFDAALYCVNNSNNFTRSGQISWWKDNSKPGRQREYSKGCINAPTTESRRMASRRDSCAISAPIVSKRYLRDALSNARRYGSSRP